MIKFFRRGSFEDAKKEEAKWRFLYGDLGFDFVKAYEKRRVLLVMPYWRVPCDRAERQKFVEGDEGSLLYKALKRFADKGFIHKEVFWHHVGLIGVSDDSSGQVKSPQSTNSTIGSFTGSIRKRMFPPTDTIGIVDIAVFCDLEHAHECEDEAKRKEWIDRSFKAMKERIMR